VLPHIFQVLKTITDAIHIYTKGIVMRIPFLSLFISSPFEGLQDHVEKVKECASVFQEAMECIIQERCENFEHFRKRIDKLESEADAIKRRIRGHLPKGTLLPFDKFELFRYLREQDKVLDATETGLDWISFRSKAVIPEILEKDFMLLVDAVIDPIEDLSKMVKEAKKYFSNFSEPQRQIVKEIIHKLRKHEHEADKLEHNINRKIFSSIDEPIVVFHLIRLSEIIGSIADHAENAGDMMRAMVAK
jgi:predicted phosphate transport protein (TIGR00153 family)